MKHGTASGNQPSGPEAITRLPGRAGRLRRFAVWGRQVLERAGLQARRRGRQEVWHAQDLGEIVPPQLDLGLQGSTIVVVARPKASMVLRVYRAATKTWEEPIIVDSVDIRPIEAKE